MLLSETGVGLAERAGRHRSACRRLWSRRFVASLHDAGTGSHVLDIVRDMRVPGGETLYDREMRLLRLKRQLTCSRAITAVLALLARM